MATSTHDARIELVMAVLASQTKPNYIGTAKKYGVARMTLCNRFLGQTLSVHAAASKYHQKLNLIQEDHAYQYSNRRKLISDQQYSTQPYRGYNRRPNKKDSFGQAGRSLLDHLNVIARLNVTAPAPPRPWTGIGDKNVEEIRNSCFIKKPDSKFLKSLGL